jgi:hypothetical protein
MALADALDLERAIAFTRYRSYRVAGGENRLWSSAAT